MHRLSLRTRIFLFFAALGFGSLAILALGLMLGYRQGTGADAAPFVAAGIVSGFGIIGVTAGIWLLFDENVAKPVERLAADLRARAHGGVTRDLDLGTAKHLGDLAPAAAAVSKRLSSATLEAADTVAQRTAELAFETQQLTAILTDIPLAVMMVNPAHQIVLYDGQSAELLEAEAPARLNAPLFDYLKEDAILDALDDLARSGKRREPIVAESRSGRFYSGHIRTLGNGAGYMLMLEPLSPDAERPLTYDFALIHAEATGDQRSAALRSLTYVIFDTETTGLDPERDEIVQIGAVRVVNGRIVEGERYDTLVNPGRPIPAGSTKVHGISDEMVVGAPDVAEAVGASKPSRRGRSSSRTMRRSTSPSCAAARPRGSPSTIRCSTPSCCRRSSSAARPPTRSTRWPTGSPSTSRATCATPRSATRSRPRRSSRPVSRCSKAAASALSAPFSPRCASTNGSCRT
jgi:DNA polymerase III subunit epsilon